MIIRAASTLRVIFFCVSILIMAAFAVAAWFNDSGSVIALAGVSLIPAPALQKNRRFRFLKNFAPANPATGIAAGAQRDTLPRDFIYNALKLRLQYQVDVAAGGGADGALAAEQPWSLIRNLQVIGSSSSRTKIANIKDGDLRAQSILQGFLQHQLPSATALAIPGIQAATICTAEVEIPFYLPRCANPRMAALNCHELSSLEVAIDWGGDMDLIVGGTRVTTITNIIAQFHGDEFLDDLSNGTKYAINMLRKIELTGVTANTALTQKIEGTNLLRGFLIKQYTRPAGSTVPTPVDTIINGARIDINGTPKIEYRSSGAAASGWNLLQRDNWDLYSCTAIPVGYAFIDLMRQGQFDELLRESDFTTIQLVLDVNTIANGCINIYPVELIDINQ